LFSHAASATSARHSASIFWTRGSTDNGILTTLVGSVYGLRRKAVFTALLGCFGCAPGHTAKPCDMELQMTPTMGSGLGRNARDLKTQREFKGFKDWNATINSCMVVNPRARIGGDQSQTDALIGDVLKFMGVRQRLVAQPQRRLFWIAAGSRSTSLVDEI
jgi:hypothetical protein